MSANIFSEIFPLLSTQVKVYNDFFVAGHICTPSNNATALVTVWIRIYGNSEGRLFSKLAVYR
jgi:hypothetical protein